MRYSAKLLSLATLAVLMVPCIQRPGFSAETRFLHQPQTPLMLAQSESAADRLTEAEALFNEALQLWRTSDFQGAWDKLQQALELYQAPDVRQAFPQESRQGEGKTLTGLGAISDSFGQYQQALSYYQQALPIRQEIGDRAGEGVTLNNIGLVYRKLGQYQQALSYYQQALPIFQEIGDRAGEGGTLNNIGGVYDNLGQYQQALSYYQQALPIFQEIGDRAGEGATLNNIGLVYDNLGQYQQALSYYQQALPIFQEIGVREAFPEESRRGEGTTLNNIGLVYINLGQYEQALSYYQQALAISQKISDRAGEGTTLNNIGGVYDNLGQYEQALSYYQQALPISQEIGDRQGEGGTLNNIGLVYYNLGQYQQALSYFQQALPIHQEIGDRAGEGGTLNNLGGVYFNLGQYEQALFYFENALTIRQELKDLEGEAGILNTIGLTYSSIGNYDQAFIHYQNALAISHELEDSHGEMIILNNIGAMYRKLSQHAQALRQYQNALAIAQEIGNVEERVTILNGIGAVYENLGQYAQALKYYEDALVIIRQETGNSEEEGITLAGMGLIYRNLGQYERALRISQEALTIQSEINSRQGIGTTLHNIGLIYNDLDDYEQALSYFQAALDIGRDHYGSSLTLTGIGLVHRNLGQSRQALRASQSALAIQREIGYQAGEATTLNNIGLIHGDLDQYQQALSHLQNALVIYKEIGDRSGRAITLNNIGYLLEALEEPELAIVFLKQSVNQFEAIRGDIRGLDTEQQQAFTDSIADTYRKLADLLLQADRVLEAQRVLDLLKVQELDEYLEDVQRNGDTQEGIASRNPEQVINDGLDERLNRAIKLNREIRELEALDELTPEQQDRLIALGQEAQQLIADFNTFLDSPEVQAQVALLRNATGGEALDLSNYRDLQDSLAALEQNAVLLYPFVLEDRLELVLVTPEVDTPIRETVAVDRVTLNQAIANYRSALESPGSDPLPLAQQLYGWLLEPLADELETIGAETIIYAPDGQLRYIPLAALHDGQQWAVEHFRINNITAASLMDIALQTRREPRVFAAAFTEGSYPISIGDFQATFYGLQYAGQEVENLANLITGTTKLLNDDFHPETALLMNRYSIVHLATHAAFVPGDPQDSFILFGNGDTVSLVDVRDWRLPDVDLVVLSACETGLGDELGDGREILGLGYQMQKAGASAAMASLWSVSDGGTQALMDAFYLALQNGYSKAEALRLAQQALIADDLSIVGGERGTIVIEDAETGEPLTLQGRLNHPYYWAPFILIGNGL
jgi:CHAT domain-containing protein/tetratricopeptide (TPR) repeat protein